MDPLHARYVHNALIASLATECIAMAALSAALRERDFRVFVLAKGLHLASEQWVVCAARAITEGQQD